MKLDCYKFYSPFFYHYTRSDQSKVRAASWPFHHFFLMKCHLVIGKLQPSQWLRCLGFRNLLPILEQLSWNLDFLWHLKNSEVDKGDILWTTPTLNVYIFHIMRRPLRCEHSQMWTFTLVPTLRFHGSLKCNYRTSNNNRKRQNNCVKTWYKLPSGEVCKICMFRSLCRPGMLFKKGDVGGIQAVNHYFVDILIYKNCIFQSEEQQRKRKKAIPGEDQGKRRFRWIDKFC